MVGRDERGVGGREFCLLPVVRLPRLPRAPVHAAPMVAAPVLTPPMLTAPVGLSPVVMLVFVNDDLGVLLARLLLVLAGWQLRAVLKIYENKM